MAQRVNAVVLGQRVVAQHGPPEVDVQVAGPGGYRDLDLLHGTTVGDGSQPTSDLGDSPRQVDVVRFRNPSREWAAR